jgi:hypothetical protein
MLTELLILFPCAACPGVVLAPDYRVLQGEILILGSALGLPD